MDSHIIFCYNVAIINQDLQGCRQKGDKDVSMREESYSVSILYIEDNLDNRILVRRVLEIEGYQVLEAGDGPTGIKLAQEQNPALILVDINMPEMDGYEVTRRLRAIDQFRDVPIIALTAKVMKGDREKTLEAGCSGYIQKPIDVDLLPMQLAAYLNQ
jgi:two-component system cell cycle response regulator DivK